MPRRATRTELGPWRIVADIASGGMASVHLARRVVPEGDHQLYALKIAHAHLADDAEFVSRFLDEARLASVIRHPNVVPVYEVGSIDDELVMAMPYVEGASLRALVGSARAAGRQLPVRVALRVVHDALLGLHAAHELRDDAGRDLGLVHRDVSPHNILVGLDGGTRIADFGVAKAKNRLVSTRGATIKGKLRYLAPEQLQSSVVDRRTDVFAAGIVLWEALTGELLFDGEDDATTLRLVLEKSIPPPSSVRPEVRMALDEACLRALERERAQRFATAADLAAALAALPGGLASTEEVAALVAELQGGAIAALRAAVDEPAAAPASRRRSKRPIAVAVVGAALALGLGGAATGALVHARRAARAGTDAPATVESAAPAVNAANAASADETAGAATAPSAPASESQAESPPDAHPGAPTTAKSPARKAPFGARAGARRGATTKWVPPAP